MHLCMPRLTSVRRGEQKDPPVFVTWQIVKSEEEKKNENAYLLDDFITPIKKKLPTQKKLSYQVEHPFVAVAYRL